MTRPAKWSGVLLALAALLLVAACAALAVGSGPGAGSGVVRRWLEDADPLARSIVLDVRLPRVLLAAIVGAALSAAGVAFQATLRNPLADPYILGVSGGAALGAVLFTVAASGFGDPWLLGRPAAAFAGAMTTLVVLFGLARARGKTEATSLLLIGVVINALDSAVILFLVTAGDTSRFQSVLFFLVGNVGSPPAPVLVLAGALVLAGLFVLVARSHDMNLLATGDDTAGHLGLDVERATWLLVAAASLVTATAVAFTGLVGFVGLIVPHALRALFGPDHRLLVPAAALGGGAFLIAADAVARTMVSPAEMPVGVVTALVGAPLFLALYLRRIREAWAMDGPALAFEQVSFSYGRLDVLRFVNLEIQQGRISAVLGPNGAGKTTLLRLAAGSLAPSGGTVKLFGRDLRSLPPKERARRVAVVPQESRLLYEFTVREVVLMGRSPHLGILGLDGPEDRAIAEAAMEQTGVVKLAGRPFGTLSGGERQRAVVARALAQEPSVLLLDEPTAFLDLRHQLAVYDLLAALARDTRRTLVVASHDLNLAARYCDRMVLLRGGRILADGPPAEVIRPDILRDVYGVEAEVGQDAATGRPFVVPRGPSGPPTS